MSNHEPASATYRIDTQRRLILCRFRQHLTYDDILALMDKIAADPDFNMDFPGVIDMRGAELNITPTQAVALAAMLAEMNMTGSGRRALLTDTPRSTALSMLYASAAGDNRPLMLFSAVEAVSAFLQQDIEQDLEQL